MYLVAGATGVLGSEICRRLTVRGRPVRAMVRVTSDAGGVSELRELGADVVMADLKERGTLEPACAGVTTVVSGATAIFRQQPGDSISSVDRDGQLALIDAAVAAGARRFVYVSFSGNIKAPSPLTDAKRTVERRLREGGLEYTILRPSYFMDTWLGPLVGFDLAARHVRIFGDGDRPVSWIALTDVAEVAARCVDEPAAANATLELGGPDALSPLEVVAIAEQADGVPIEVEHVPVEQLEAQRAAAGNETEATLAALMINLARGDVVAGARAQTWLPAPSTSVRDHVGLVMPR